MKPLPHSTPPASADATVRTLAFSERFEVFARRTRPKKTCMPTMPTRKTTTKATAVFAMTFSTLEPEGSSEDSGSTSTAWPFSLRWRRSRAAR